MKASASCGSGVGTAEGSTLTRQLPATVELNRERRSGPPRFGLSALTSPLAAQPASVGQAALTTFATRALPPLALERSVSAERFVERVERSHVLVGQREVEEPAVLLDSIAVR